MKKDFFKYQAQTSPQPLSIEISKAKGSFIYDISGKKYLNEMTIEKLYNHINMRFDKLEELLNNLQKQDDSA